MALADDIRACTKCDLHRTRIQAVPLSGTGPIAIVGEAPGKEEDMVGIPFIGPAGQVLNEGLKAAGLTRGDVATLNVVCCRPYPDNQFANAEDVGAVEACRPWFYQQLDSTRSWLVILAGGAPLRVVSKDQATRGGPGLKSKITQERGKPWWFEGRLWLPTLHPSFALRSGGIGGANGKLLVQDLTFAKNLVDGSTTVPPDDWGELAPISSERATTFPANIYSNILGEIVTVVRDITEAPDTPYPVWTLTELARIKAYEIDKFGLHDLKRVATVKRSMRAEIVM